ncbi:G-protein coupled receptor 161-like [Dendronephthya gigantea]|uniref:G-protein coupled receptor 161-like n=1 Tax=Dendronephthya gigantea TaxID=151771 RepID=UPI00106AB9A6|nr:G-protein coupled receptor 161-like [Dendronephthya gigantea]
MDWPWHDVLISLLFLAIPICLFNLIFVILICNRGNLGRLQNVLFLSLGCSDFCAGFLAIPCILMCNLVNNVTLSCRLCIVSYLLNRFILTLSFLNLSAVIYERYLKIVHPFWFRNREYTLLKGSRVMIGIWLTSLVICLTPLTFWPLDKPCSSDKTFDINLQFFDIACFALFIILLLFMIYAFVRIFLVVRSHLLDINTTAVQLRASMNNILDESGSAASNENSRQSNSETNNNRSRTHPGKRESESSRLSAQSLHRQFLLKEVKIVLRFAAMVFMFVVTWGSYYFLSFYERNKEDVPIIAQEIVFVIRFMNPLFDPFILTVNNSDFRFGIFNKIISRVRSSFVRRQSTTNQHSSEDFSTV